MDVAGKTTPVLTDADSLYKIKEYTELMRQQFEAVSARADVSALTQSFPDQAWTQARFQTVTRETTAGMVNDAGGYYNGIKPNVGGVYLMAFAFGVGGLSAPATQSFGLRIQVNGGTEATLIIPASISGASASVVAVAFVGAGQLVSADVYQRSGAARVPSAGSLSITRLSAPVMV